MQSKIATTMIPFLFVWLWSTGFVGARFGLPYIEPFHILTWRFALTIPVFLILILTLGKRWLNIAQIKVQLVVGAVLHGLYLGGVFYAVSIGTPAGIAAIIVGMQPILTAVINRVLFGQSVSTRQTVGLVLGFIGLLAVILGSAEISGSSVGLQGLAACIVALFGITIATLIQKHYGANTPLMAGTFWQYVGSLTVVGIASLMLETHAVDHQWQLYAALFWMVIPLSTAAVLLLMYMISVGEVAKVTSYFYLVPPVAVVQTWWLFDEALSVTSLVGCLVVVLGVALVVRD
ncbi:MAG: DMT family transporter [Proteobacteria bacterium]|nr:DMT family transporter [Pseudomonadota bacterium]